MLAMVAFSLMSIEPKMPVRRRSSVRRANPFLMAFMELSLWTRIPFRNTRPSSLALTPKMVSSSSDRPEPTSPASPKISPFLTEKETSWMALFPYLELRCLTSRLTSPGVLVFGGKRLVSARPTILAMIWSIVRSLALSVDTHLPSRMMVTSSDMRRISSILWEM